MKKIMKHKFQCLLFFMLLLPAIVMASTQDVRVNINFVNAPMSNVLDEIGKQTSLPIVYHTNDVNPDRLVSIEASNEVVTSVMERLLANTNVTYSIDNKGLVLTTRNLGVLGVQQDKITVKGKVTDANGEALIGVSILVKGTATGAISDLNGAFTVLASKGDVLEITYIGYTPQTITVLDNRPLNVVMAEDTKVLDEVVVTAMGIERKSTSLTYSTDLVKGSELTRSKETNLINSLQGKSAGLVITPNSTGAGGSSKILLRGNTSIMGNNQPLIVVDGVPLQNHETSQINSTYGGQRDGGDAISNINPDDVESISVLKGASAAALYGSMAANGVIMITTKKGMEGKIKVDISSNTSFETPLVTPKFQNEYGANKVGSSDQLEAMTWGDKISSAPGRNNVSDFLRTGSNFNNSVAISGGSANSQTYFSYANTTAFGIMPTNDFMRHNITFKQNFSLFEKKLNLGFSANYVNQQIDNKPSSGRLDNPLTGLYLLPRNDAITNYEEYEINEKQNWPYLAENEQNPYWILNRMPLTEKRNRVILSGNATWDILSCLKLSGRLSFDRTNDDYERKIYASSYNITKGRLTSGSSANQQIYADVMATFDKNFNGINLNVVAGSSYNDVNNTSSSIYAGDEQDPYFTNWFIPGNVKLNPAGAGWTTKRKISVFGSVQLGLYEMANIDITARNDWSSTLINTDNSSYFYPSFGANLLLNKMFTLPEVFNLAKVRASYSIVGNDIPDKIASPSKFTRLIMSSGGSLTLPEDAPFRELKPEKTHSLEVGFELAMLDNRFNFDFTYYKTNTKNQLFKVSAPWGSGYRYRYINAGNLQNTGFEVSAGWMQEFNKDWTWITKLNFSYNQNEIKELVKGLEDQKLSEAEGFYMYLKEGGSYGDIYVADVSLGTDKDTGKPIVEKSVTADKYVGNLESKVHAGWSNTINYKDFSLYFLIDSKFGGKVISITQGFLDSYGVSEQSAEARNAGGIMFEGQKIDPKQYYNTVGQGPFAGSDYVYDATNVRLRELSLGYTFRGLFGPSKNLSVSLVGRNLFFFYKNAPVDPDISTSTANGWQGIECFALPTSRSYGLNLKLTF